MSQDIVELKEDVSKSSLYSEDLAPIPLSLTMTLFSAKYKKINWPFNPTLEITYQSDL